MDEKNVVAEKCSFFKKKGSFAARKRRNESGDESDESKSVIVRKDKREALNPMKQSTARIKRPRPEVSTISDGDSDNESISVSYKSKKVSERVGPRDMGATAEYELDTLADRDARAIFEKSLELNKELKGKEEDKVYRGLANYQQFYEKRDTAQGSAASASVRKGPIRAPTNIRSTVRWDYQPDICKDFKETGFCGFGDSCKFMHDRSDYKFGWQLEREATIGGGDERSYEIEDFDEESHVPFKCFICRESFKDPIVTKCQHYFCEQCALTQYRKNTRCYVCNVQTGGVFNPAKQIMAKLDKQKSKGPENGNESD